MKDPLACMVVYLLSYGRKVYVGKTTKALRKRLQQHWYWAKDGSQFPVHRAILKYGFKNFQVVILASADSEEDLNLLEIRYIREYQATNPEFGWNLTEGGDGTSGFHHAEETKVKIGDANRNRVYSEESIQNMVDAHLGHVPTPEALQNMSTAMLRLGIKPPPGSHKVPHSEETKAVIRQKLKKYNEEKRQIALQGV